MTKTLYDPLVEQRGIERGIEKERKKVAAEKIEKIQNALATCKRHS